MAILDPRDQVLMPDALTIAHGEDDLGCQRIGVRQRVEGRLERGVDPTILVGLHVDVIVGLLFAARDDLGLAPRIDRVPVAMRREVDRVLVLVAPHQADGVSEGRHRRDVIGRDRRPTDSRRKGRAPVVVVTGRCSYQHIATGTCTRSTAAPRRHARARPTRPPSRSGRSGSRHRGDRHPHGT